MLHSGREVADTHVGTAHSRCGVQLKADALDVSDIRWQLWDENIDPICRQKNSIFFFLCFCMQHLTGDRMTTVMNLQVFRRLNEKLDSQLKQEKVKAELTIITKTGIRIEL